tara:strand:- start:68 stop:310 length:243 start_codon:yes stop_codon:yes gene_type:complete
MTLSIAQKILYYVLIALVILMIVFSFQARSNLGKKGFDACIEKKCERSQEHCSKFREINNCCLGAGGKTALQEGKGVCIF